MVKNINAEDFILSTGNIQTGTVKIVTPVPWWKHWFIFPRTKVQIINNGETMNFIRYLWRPLLIVVALIVGTMLIVG